jgi:hypothetical protein
VRARANLSGVSTNASRTEWEADGLRAGKNNGCIFFFDQAGAIKIACVDNKGSLTSADQK